MQTTAPACSEPSLLTPMGYQAGDCGYCKAEGQNSGRTPNSRASYYVRSKSLCPDHYQELMDRGWRRSGTLLYLPDAIRSCCPHYTIRLPAADLKPQRDQRQALNRWNRFVLGDEYAKEVAKKFPKSKEGKKREKTEFDFLSVVHESEAPNLKPGIEPAHHFEVTLEPDSFTEEKYNLYDAYQRHVHHEGEEDISRAGFKRFLCSSPVHRHGAGGKRTGSFHQLYRLDGRLIAIGVVDLMPYAVSGVYFIYHPDFEQYSFGKLSALREAALAVEGRYQYYYMGYYIHTCKKMRYKGDYRTQQVLDYDTRHWHPLDDEMRALMDKRRWVSINRENIIKEVLPDATMPWKNSDDATHASTVQDDDISRQVYGAKHPEALVACESGLSLLELGMPGVISLEEVENSVNLDEVKVTLRQGGIYRMRHLVAWEAGSEMDATSLKGIVAEFAACVGPVIAEQCVLDFTR